jgi:chitosanase
MSIREATLEIAAPPTTGADETAYLEAFLDQRELEMNKEEAHSDTSRVSTGQRVFLREGNLGLQPPLAWHVYGDAFEIAAD